MKREIKFRAWDKESKKMVDLHSITPLALSDSMNTQLALKGMDGLFIPFSGEFELMQFTGLKDKNGKEIYEGDIVSVENDENPVVTQCVYELGQFCLIDNAGGSWTRQFYHQPKRLEVIGNIYESPELKNQKP